MNELLVFFCWFLIMLSGLADGYSTFRVVEAVGGKEVNIFFRRFVERGDEFGCYVAVVLGHGVLCALYLWGMAQVKGRPVYSDAVTYMVIATPLIIGIHILMVIRHGRMMRE